jgi:hypothetical protein
MSAKDPRAELVAKAVKDPKFREELKKNPAAAIEKAVGVKLPAGLSIKVVEDSSSVVHLVLPPQGSGKPLSERELSAVAGGTAPGDESMATAKMCQNNTGFFTDCAGNVL